MPSKLYTIAAQAGHSARLARQPASQPANQAGSAKRKHQQNAKFACQLELSAAHIKRTKRKKRKKKKAYK